MSWLPGPITLPCVRVLLPRTTFNGQQQPWKSGWKQPVPDAEPC